MTPEPPELLPAPEPVKLNFQTIVGAAGELAPLVQRESKAGYRTTEFWVTLATILGLLVNLVPAPQSKEGLYAVIVGGAYTLSRGLAKLGVANIAHAFGSEDDPEAELPGGITEAQRAELS